MTVSTLDTSIKRFTGNGSTTSFSLSPMPFLLNTDLEVKLVQASTGVETLQVLNSDYTVTGGDGATGSVVMSVAPASGKILVVKRVTAKVQSLDLVENGEFLADEIEDALDRLTHIVQENAVEVSRIVTLPDTFEADSLQLPEPATGYVLVWNDDGDGFDNAEMPDSLSGILTDKTLVNPLMNIIKDSNSNTVLQLEGVSSAVNYLRIDNAAAGNNVRVATNGSSSNIGIDLQPLGTGSVSILGNASQEGRLKLYENTGTGTNAITIKPPSSVTADRTISLPDTDVSSFLVQRVSTTVSTVATGTTTVPLDNTVPQNTEGDQYMSLAITPKSSSNILNIKVIFNGSCTAVTYVVLGLFQDSTASAISSTFVSSDIVHGTFQINLNYNMTAGTTSATTFKVRVGPSTAATVTFNGYNTNAYLGGTINSTIVIEEYSA